MTSARLLAGRYRLLDPLGRGGMGIVWRARDEMLGREVAVKELTLDLPTEERRMACDRARREARAAALLDHPSIIKVHDVIDEDDRPWIVMELLAGRSFDLIMAQGLLPPARVAAVGLSVLAALRAAHANNVLHRDIKPANIFARDDGRVVLTDFGIATITGETALTRSGAFVGSPAYMAPERARGEPGGPASDLWSLGATLYALAEGKSPFARTTPMGTLSAVLTEQPGFPANAGPLGPLLMAMLARDPAARPSADATEQALRAVAAGSSFSLPERPEPVPPGVVTVPPMPTRALRAPRRWKAPVLAVTLAVLAAAVVIGGFTLWPGAFGRPAKWIPSDPMACTLLTQQQATSLIGAPNVPGGRSGGCSWKPPEPQKGLSIGVSVTWLAPINAHSVFVTSTAEAATSTVHKVSNIGDEAFGVSPAPDPDPLDGEVFFRVSNVVVKVSVGAAGATVTPPPSVTYPRALRAARWVAQALRRQESPRTDHAALR